MLETMRWESNSLVLLDQTKLPLKKEYIVCDDYLRVKLAIQKLEVRGAPAIGVAAAFAVVLGLLKLGDKGNILSKLRAIAEDLIAARPTAINLAWAVNRQYSLAEKLLKKGASYEIVQAALEKQAQKLYENDIKINKKIGAYGAALLPDKSVVLTHCNAGALATCGWGTALGVIRSAWEAGKLVNVYADETRPLLQGARLTAFELCEEGIPVTLITDSMAAWSMKKRGINAVVVGADRIAANGDTANKIGTYGVALAAKIHNIPFYIAAPTSTFDFSLSDGDGIPIEERQGCEITCYQSEITAPAAVATFNPAFDVTPNEYIAGIITEYGVIKAPYVTNIEKLQDMMKENGSI